MPGAVSRTDTLHLISTSGQEDKLPRRSPFEISLTSEEQAELERIARTYTLPYFFVMRAKLVLLAAAGFSNREIAARLDCGPDVVCQWRKRFWQDGLDGLQDEPRSGRPRRQSLPQAEPKTGIQKEMLSSPRQETSGGRRRGARL